MDTNVSVFVTLEKKSLSLVTFEPSYDDMIVRVEKVMRANGIDRIMYISDPDTLETTMTQKPIHRIIVRLITSDGDACRLAQVPFFLSQLQRYNVCEGDTHYIHDETGENITVYTLNTSWCNKMHEEHAYLDLMNRILQTQNHHDNVRPDRTGTGTLSMFAPNPLRFSLSNQHADHILPMYTTKFVSFKATLLELLWILKGQTDSKLLESQGVKIWRDNTSRDFLDKRGLTYYKEGDTGPLYANLRLFNCDYKGCEHNHLLSREDTGGVDQLARIIENIKKDPFSRRHIMTTFNPATVDQCALYPCHGIVIQFYVDGKNELSCHVYIRSNDMFLGNPFNVTSYALLTHIVAMYTNMRARTLVISFGDAHIYANHVQQVNQQLLRSPLPFPLIKINDDIKNKPIESLEASDFELIGYMHHPSIKATMAI